MELTLEKILLSARKHQASDVHLVAGLSPALRINGDIRIVEGRPLEANHLKAIYDSLLNPSQKDTFDREWQVCFSRRIEGIGRFRISVYLHAGGPEFSIRLCESTIRPATELGLPEVIDDLARLNDGLVLVTGPTGMGKTTTLNYIINSINESRRAKVITLEDPVEFEHRNQRSIIIQQELLGDVKSYQSALRHVLRQDPDVIVIGEMRDLDTMETALTAAETGHLVIATLHTPDSVQTVQRIYSVFPAEQQNSITVQLANSLQAIVAQKLLPRATDGGRVLACEVCVATPAVRNHIREKQPHLIYSEMQTGRRHKMQTMDQTLLGFYQQGTISYDIALTHAYDQDFIRHRVEKGGDATEESTTTSRRFSTKNR
jgi:twitching motility protein PilT